MRVPGARRSVLLVGMALVLVSGCGSNSGGDDLQTIDPAAAAHSPATSSAPAGSVVPLAGIEEISFDSASGILAATTNDRTTLLLLDTHDAAATPRKVDLGTAGAGVTRGRPGEVLVPADHRILRVDLRSGNVEQVDVDGNAHAVALLADGRLAVGLADGRTQLIDTATGDVESISGLASVDGLAVTGDSVSAVDRRQTSITELDLGAKSLGLALRAGDGATNISTDRFGRILLTDTRGGELLVYTADPLVLRQRFPVPAAPYAIAYDDHAELVWITLTGSNEVVGFDLATGIPKEVKRFPTVRQPNSIAVDSATGDVYVGSATGDGLQRIGGS